MRTLATIIAITASSLAFSQQDSLYNAQGLKLVQNEHYNEAIEQFSKAIHIDSTKSTYYNNRGVGYRITGQTSQAHADYKKALRYCKQCATPFNNRGFLYLTTNEYHIALLDFMTAISLDSTHISANKNLQQTWKKLQLPEKHLPILKEKFDEFRIDSTMTRKEINDSLERFIKKIVYTPQ